MLPVGFETPIPASERTQNQLLKPPGHRDRLLNYTHSIRHFQHTRCIYWSNIIKHKTVKTIIYHYEIIVYEIQFYVPYTMS